jgi:ABC-2 type transport system permease protein
MTVFARTCAAEWTRLWTVRSTWWLLAAAALIMVGLGAVAGFSVQPADQGDPAWRAAGFTGMPAQFALLALALGTVASDYATGGIVPTLQWTPRRGVLFAARSLVAVGTAAALGVLLAATSSLVGYAAGRPVLSLSLDEGVDTLAKAGLVFAAGSALAVGLGFLLRSTAAALVTVLLLLLVLPGLLPQFGYRWLTDLADLLPGVGAIFLLLGEPAGRGLTDASAVLTMVAWAAAALLLGWLRLLRDDAH